MQRAMANHGNISATASSIFALRRVITQQVGVLGGLVGGADDDTNGVGRGQDVRQRVAELMTW